MTYEYVDGPMAGRTVSLPDAAHDFIVYEAVDLDTAVLQGTSWRYELRKDADGIRRLYHVPPKGLLSQEGA